VLIVDDEVTEIATIRRVLETDKAFRIFTAAHYHEAVKISQAHCAEIDLALLDVTLTAC